MSEASGNAATLLVDAHIAATEGNQRALAYRDKHYTFHDLAALVNRAGNMLRSLGVERGARAMILLPPSPVWFGTMLGAIKLGAVPIVTAETPNVETIRAACGRHQPALAIVDGTRLGEWRGALGATRIVVAGEPQGGAPSLVELLRAAPSSLAAEAVADSAPALIVLGANGETSADHAALTRAAGGKPSLAMRVAELDLSAALAALAACREVTIPTAS
jgi:acyl-CoA synthetase (AMP-forming)/AMP-acid ligase II